MKAAALVLALLLSIPARAADDAPLACVAPSRCVTVEQQASAVRVVEGLKAENKVLKEAPPEGVPLGVVIAGAIVAVLAIGAATVGGYEAGRAAPRP